MKPPKYIAFDCETGGVSDKNSLLTSYFVIMDEDKNSLDELHLKLRPEKEQYVYEPKALEINGINLDELIRCAIPLVEARERLAAFLSKHSGIIPLGQNIGFDLKFIWKYLIKKEEWLKHCTEQVEDTLDIARDLQKSGKLSLPALKLGILCDHFHIPLANAHSERDDTLAAAYLHSRLVILRDEKTGTNIGEGPAPDRPPPAPNRFDSQIPLVPVGLVSDYTVLRGASSVKDYAAYCKKMGLPGFAVTDRGWATGCLETYDLGQKHGIVPVPGITIYVADGSSHYCLNLYAMNEEGYRNILWISSRGFSRDLIDNKQRYETTKHGSLPRVALEEIIPHLGGIAVGTGNYEGLFGRLHNTERKQEIEGIVKSLYCSADALFLEVVPRSLTHIWSGASGGFAPYPDGDLQKMANVAAMECSRELGFPLLMNVDSYYTTPDMRPVQDILLQNLDDSGGSRLHRSHHIPDVQEAHDGWVAMHGDGFEAEFIDAVLGGHSLLEAVRNLRIANEYRLPPVELPADIAAMDATESDKMKMLIVDKIDFHGRMRWSDPKWEERLEMELRVICDNGKVDFSKYFLFLEQWLGWCRDNSILTGVGRGSASGSLLSYLLKITHIDPFEYDLPFERFLSEGRISRGKFPDIDSDLGERDLLMAKLAEVYGDHFAHCTTHGKLRIKSSIKDAARILLGWNSSDPRIDAITKSIPAIPVGVNDLDFLEGYTDKDGVIHEGHLTQNSALQEFFTNNQGVYDMVVKMLGIARSVGRAASAKFISDRPIHETVPTCEVSGQVCSQYTAPPIGENYAEKAGLVKFDFLRINTLMDMSLAIRLIQRSRGYKVWKESVVINGETFEMWKGELSIEQLPMPDGRMLDVYSLPEDESVFLDFDQGKTESVFQMNSSLMTGFVKRIKPRTLKDCSDVVSLVRPGPLAADIGGGLTMTEAYIRRRNGEDPVSYVHPGMEPVLKMTQGVMVYQEQLQRLFSDLAGYNAEEADKIREMIGKKKKQDMEKILPDLRARLKARGWTEDQAQVFVNLCISSASYSFNASHGIAYGTVSYQCMFLKHHFPLEWWAAVLQNAKPEEIKEKNYTRAVRDILQLPHINGPTDTFDLTDGKVHAPLSLIKQLGEGACKAIQDGRKGGPYLGMRDFFERANVNSAVFSRLIICGAFNVVEPGKSARELLEFYYGLRRVSDLKKYGKGKKGLELELALEQYLAAGETVDYPELAEDDISLEMQRFEFLPIHRLDVHELFHRYLQTWFLYDAEGRATYRSRAQATKVLRNINDVESHYRKNGAQDTCAWAGFLRSQSEFQYKDKKTGNLVTALKMFISNDGDDVICICWPDMYDDMKKKKFDAKLVLCVGNIKPDREPGKWSMSVQHLSNLMKGATL